MGNSPQSQANLEPQAQKKMKPARPQSESHLVDPSFRQTDLATTQPVAQQVEPLSP